MAMISLPIACSLTDTELQQRRSTVLEKFKAAVIETTELTDGYCYSLPSSSDDLMEVAALVNLERQCCAFLKFTITVEPANGPILLSLTGPPGTKEFLDITFNNQPQ